jgi:LytTr DNA-binding domain
VVLFGGAWLDPGGVMNGMGDVKNADAKNATGASRVEPVWDADHAARDETKSPGTGGGLLGISGANWRVYAAVATISLTTGLVNALSAAQDAARRGEAYNLATPLLWEMSSIAAVILVVPVLFFAVKRMRASPHWGLRVALAAVATITFSALHIAGMVGIRKAVRWLAGSAYDFHFSLATVIYEFRKDALTSLLIGGTLWLIDRRSNAKPFAPPATVPGESLAKVPDMVWLRDGASRIRVAPRDIVWISSAGNYVEYRLANGDNHLIRGTLAGAEAELASFKLSRIHRTRLANLHRVTAVDMKPSGDFELTFDTGQTLQGSRRYRDAVATLGRWSAAK